MLFASGIDWKRSHKLKATRIREVSPSSFQEQVSKAKGGLSEETGGEKIAGETAKVQESSVDFFDIEIPKENAIVNWQEEALSHF